MQGISFCDVLAILFIALKLCDVIDWSWLWVLSPIWIPIPIMVMERIMNERKMNNNNGLQ